MEEFGFPPNFPEETDLAETEATRDDPVIKDKSKGKKSKAVAKAGLSWNHFFFFEPISLYSKVCATFHFPIQQWLGNIRDKVYFSHMIEKVSIIFVLMFRNLFIFELILMTSLCFVFNIVYFVANT